MSKLFLTSMSNDDIENIKEFYNHDILPFFDGLIHVLHTTERHYHDRKGQVYLENLDIEDFEKKVICREYVQRNDFSMNEILYCGVMEPESYFVFADLLERVKKPFVQKIKSEIIPLMEANGIDVLYYYGKPFLIKYSEYLKFVHSPHWSLQGFRNGAEYSHVEKDESKVRLNMRPLKRDKWHFVSHYCRYLLMPPGSNTMALGLEKRGNPQELFPMVEKQRLEFREYLRFKNFPLTIEGVKELIKNPLDEKGLYFFNEIKILNDMYRYYILKDLNFIDDHDYNNRVKIV